MNIPRLRMDLEPVPVTVSGRQAILLRDPLNLSSHSVVLGPHEIFLAAHMDGQRRSLDLQEAFMRQHGVLVYTEDIDRLVQRLDEQVLFDNDRFRDRLKEEVQRFKASPIRESTHAGLSYEMDPSSLAQSLESFYLDDEGPGLPSLTKERQDLAGILVPHIDFTRGGRTYAWGHKTIVESARQRTFLILGTAHRPGKHAVMLAPKAFATPFGVVPCHEDAVDFLKSRMDFDITEDEFLHRQEHSVEFQVVFLQHDFPQDKLRIVPVLMGLFDEELTGSTGAIEEVHQFVACVRELMDQGEEILPIASVDLSHMGPSFGDPRPLSFLDLSDVRDQDLALLRVASERGAEEFRETMRTVHMPRRVCGTPAIYALLKILEGRTGPGNLLKYEQCVSKETGDLVSIASMAFSSRPLRRFLTE